MCVYIYMTLSEVVSFLVVRRYLIYREYVTVLLTYLVQHIAVTPIAPCEHEILQLATACNDFWLKDNILNEVPNMWQRSFCPFNTDESMRKDIYTISRWQFLQHILATKFLSSTTLEDLSASLSPKCTHIHILRNFVFFILRQNSRRRQVIFILANSKNKADGS